MTIGTCSECGGRVSVPDNWMSTVPAVPTCDSCGARAKHPHGPTVPPMSDVPRPEDTVTIPLVEQLRASAVLYSPTSGDLVGQEITRAELGELSGLLKRAAEALTPPASPPSWTARLSEIEWAGRHHHGARHCPVCGGIAQLTASREQAYQNAGTWAAECGEHRTRAEAAEAKVTALEAQLAEIRTALGVDDSQQELYFVAGTVRRQRDLFRASNDLSATIHPGIYVVVVANLPEANKGREPPV